MTLEHDAVRDGLVAATLKLMDEGGLEKVKARTVAQNVGVSVGTVYNLFGNVDGLIQAANSRIFDDLNQLGQTEMARIGAALTAAIGAGTIEDTAEGRTRFRLLALSQTYIGFVVANQNRWAALLAFNRLQGGANLADWYLAQQEGLIGIIGHTLAESPLAADHARMMLAARALWSAVHGIVTMNYVGQSRADARDWTMQQIDLLVGLFVHGAFAR